MPDFSDIYKEASTPRSKPSPTRSQQSGGYDGIVERRENQQNTYPGNYKPRRLDRLSLQDTASVQNFRPIVERRHHKDRVEINIESARGKTIITQYPKPQPPMAGTNPYIYSAPPPAPVQQPQYGYLQPPQYQQPQRGGGAPRGGRGGPAGRADFHTPYNPHQPNAGYDPHRPQGPPQQHGPPTGYQGQGVQQPAPYIGPQVPQAQSQSSQSSGYSATPQWQPPQQHNQQHGQPHHGSQQYQPPAQHPPQAAPLSAQNYHPNYAPQAYQPQQPHQAQPAQQNHYGPPQPQPFQPTHTPTYGHGVTPQQQLHAPAPQWQPPQSQHARPPFNANNNRGRGGFTGGRGTHEQAPLMGPPIRMGFDKERGGHSQAGSGYQPQNPSHQSPPAASFNQPQYQGYPPPQDFRGGQRPSLDPNPFNSPQRGRGGGGGNNSNFRGGDRRNNSNHHQHSRGDRGRNDHGRNDHGRNDHRQGNRAPSDFHNKSAVADVNGKNKKNKKRRTNTLGLTPNGVDHEDSDVEVDDVDEEARLVTLLGPDTPQLPTDLEAWLAERKSRFPTKARRDAAAEQLRQRREQSRNKRKQDNGIKHEAEMTPAEKQQRKVEKLRRELEKAERKIQQDMSGGKRKRENEDIGDEEASDDSKDSSGSESDSKPETQSTRSQGSSRFQAASLQSKSQLQRHCKYFSTGGTCGKKGKCRFVHDQEVRNQALRDKDANGGKMTLAQRLILNDTAKDDLTILKSIKYLKEKGLMPDQLAGNNYDDDGRDNGYTENLNYGDH